LPKLKTKAIDQEYFNQVEMALGVKQEVGCLVKECEIDLNVCVTWVSLYSTILESYDIVV
jgi:hypothetical protein